MSFSFLWIVLVFISPAVLASSASLQCSAGISVKAHFFMNPNKDMHLNKVAQV